MQLPASGDVLGNQYQLGAPLGEGTFAIVFRALDLRIEREVAIKVLKPRDGGYSRALRGRFTREVRAMGALQDPHTIQVFSNGETEDGVLWFACELLGGLDLADWIERHGALDEASAVHVLRQLLHSVREVHAAGLIHRDIKPGNIRVFRHLDDPFFVKLMDFGVAKPTGAEVTQLTRTGGVVGTLRFMPPEQLSGEVTFASDIYALGVVMLDMLHGHRVPLEVVTGPRPVALPASGRLSAIVHRMIEPNVDRRLPSAEAVLHQLNAPQDAPRPTPSQSPQQPRLEGRRRRPVTKVAGIALAVVVAGLVVIAVWSSSSDVAAPPPVVTTRPNPLAAPPERARQPEPDAGRAAPDLAVTRGSGCGEEVPRGDTTGRAFVGARQVEWHLYVPQTYDADEPAPVVFFFYDGVTATDAAMEHTNIRELADRLNAVLIAPLRDTSKIDWDAHTTRDFAAILDEVDASHCVDRSRIFALGHEVGGHAAVALSCEPWVRAVATTAYRQTTLAPPCEPWTPKPIIMFAPRDYPGLPIEGGTKCGITAHMSLEQHEKVWWERNECKSKGRLRKYDHGECQEWNCKAPTVSCVVDGGLGWRGAPRRNFDIVGCDGAPTQFDYLDVIATEFASFD